PVEVPTMRFARLWGMTVLATALGLVAVGVSGCGKEAPKEGGGGDKPSAGGGGDKPSGGGKKTLTAFTAKATGTLKGQVKYKGTPPAPQKQEFVKDTEHCSKGQGNELLKQNWLIGANGGVEYVAVWLRPPDGHYFDVPADQRKRTDTVTIDQPHCAFIPH